jgi:hypothetical protein
MVNGKNSLMNKEFIPYEQALELKELGFDEPCFGYFDNTQIKGFLFDTNLKVKTLVFAPTYSQAFRFFRDKYGLFTQPNRTIGTSGVWYYFSIATKRTDVCEGSFSYEEAELTCLNKLIEIVKNK